MAATFRIRCPNPTCPYVGRSQYALSQHLHQMARCDQYVQGPEVPNSAQEHIRPESNDSSRHSTSRDSLPFQDIGNSPSSPERPIPTTIEFTRGGGKLIYRDRCSSIRSLRSLPSEEPPLFSIKRFKSNEGLYDEDIAAVAQKDSEAEAQKAAAVEEERYEATIQALTSPDQIPPVTYPIVENDSDSTSKGNEAGQPTPNYNPTIPTQINSSMTC